MTKRWNGRLLFLAAMALALGGYLISTIRPTSGFFPDMRGGSGHTAEAAQTTLPPGRELATLSGGCFWSMEAIFKQLKGVDRAEPGYSGGKLAGPSYEQVESGTTGHAESLQITFNPKVISYHDLLTVFFTVRDPTTLNRQGPDEGPQYRSIVFYRNAEQKATAQQVMREITAKHLWRGPIVTQLAPFSHFYVAEAYHHDYFRLHPDEPYCKYVVAPEVSEFRAKFRARLKQ